MTRGHWFPAITISMRYSCCIKYFPIKEDGIIPALQSAIDYFFMDQLRNSEQEHHQRMRELASMEHVEEFFADKLSKAIQTKIKGHKIVFCCDHRKNDQPKFLSPGKKKSSSGYNALVLNIPNGTRMTKHIHSISELFTYSAVFSSSIFHELYSGRIHDEALSMHFIYMKSTWFYKFLQAEVITDQNPISEMAKYDIKQYFAIVENSLNQLKKQVPLSCILNNVQINDVRNKFVA
ncbi:hypothetical protein [Photobacterium damselae]|uniref:hypothetical protein n=1 Tax=Photobacterium damselae TaxID=38293 RepID=UPI0040681B16